MHRGSWVARENSGEVTELPPAPKPAPSTGGPHLAARTCRLGDCPAPRALLPTRLVNKTRFKVPAEAAGLRLDQCLARCVPELSRRTARIALDLGAVFVGRKRVKVASRAVEVGQEITVHLGGAFERATRQVGRAARSSDEQALPPPEVLYEDGDLIVVNKAAGVLTAPTPESDRNNLLSQLRQRVGMELFVVHRIDLQTSGVLVFAKNAHANRSLAEVFREHQLTRRYDVLASGVFPPELQTIEADVGGKRAVTHLTLVQQRPLYCHLEATLETGRTHQIRIHLNGVGHPVLADPKYGPGRQRWHPPRLALHARTLAFPHPADGRLVTFETALPEDLRAFLARNDEAVPPAQ